LLRVERLASSATSSTRSASSKVFTATPGTTSGSFHLNPSCSMFIALTAPSSFFPQQQLPNGAVN
jgi:hypothetical protein